MECSHGMKCEAFVAESGDAEIIGVNIEVGEGVYIEIMYDQIITSGDGKVSSFFMIFENIEEAMNEVTCEVTCDRMDKVSVPDDWAARIYGKLESVTILLKGEMSVKGSSIYTQKFTLYEMDGELYLSAGCQHIRLHPKTVEEMDSDELYELVSMARQLKIRDVLDRIMVVRPELEDVVNEFELLVNS